MGFWSCHTKNGHAFYEYNVKNFEHIIRLNFYGCNETVAKIVEEAPGPHEVMHTEHPQKQAINCVCNIAGTLFMQSVSYIPSSE